MRADAAFAKPELYEALEKRGLMDSRAVVHFYAFPDPLFRRPRLLLATARGGAPDTASVRAIERRLETLSVPAG